MALRAFLASMIIAVAGISVSLAQASFNHQLDIPQQELGSALAMLAKQANIQLVYSTQLVEGKRSPAISGSMTPEVALERLLGPFELRFEFLDPVTVTISTSVRADFPSGPVPVSRMDSVGVLEPGDPHEASTG